MCIGYSYPSSILEEYHQYDTVVYPRNVRTKTRTEKVWSMLGTLRSWLPGGSKQEDVEEDKILTLSEMCEVCLHIYLEPFRSMLSKCDYRQEFVISNTCKQIEHITLFFRCPKFVYQKSYAADERPQRDLPQVLQYTGRNCV